MSEIEVHIEERDKIIVALTSVGPRGAKGDKGDKGDTGDGAGDLDDLPDLTLIFDNNLV